MTCVEKKKETRDLSIVVCWMDCSKKEVLVEKEEKDGKESSWYGNRRCRCCYCYCCGIAAVANVAASLLVLLRRCCYCYCRGVAATAAVAVTPLLLLMSWSCCGCCGCCCCCSVAAVAISVAVGSGQWESEQWIRTMNRDNESVLQ